MPSFGDEISRLTPHLRRFARALVRGHATQVADDLVQETVVLAMRAERVARGTHLTAWCFAALMRLHRLRHPSASTGPLSDRSGRPANGGPASPTLAFLPRAIAKLDALSLDDREVLLLAALVGMTYAQIAETLHVTRETVLARLTHARRHLDRIDAGASSGLDASGRRRPTGHLRLVK